MKIFGTNEHDSLITFYTIFHFSFGFLWYFLYAFIEGKFKNQTETLIISFLLMMYVHLIFEHIENVPFGIHFFQKWGWRLYGGDSVANSIMDHIASALGFWIAYFMFRNEKIHKKLLK